MDSGERELLIEMRREQREDHQKLVEKVEEGFEKIATRMQEHEKADLIAFGELKPVLESHRSIRKYRNLLIGALIAGGVDMLFDHLPRILSKLR